MQWQGSVLWVFQTRCVVCYVLLEDGEKDALLNGEVKPLITIAWFRFSTTPHAASLMSECILIFWAYLFNLENYYNLRSFKANFKTIMFMSECIWIFWAYLFNLENYYNLWSFKSNFKTIMKTQFQRLLL